MLRNDAKQVKDIPLFNNIFPFILKRRCDSLVYHKLKLDVSDTVEYIRAYNSKKPEIRMKFFYVFTAAMVRTMIDRPELNRFIRAKRFWQRNEHSMTFIMKENFTDQSPETSCTVRFAPTMVLEDYAKILDKKINEMRNEMSSSHSDKVIGTLVKAPKFIISIVMNLLRLLENMGIYPSSLRDADGLHSSFYISNLGSIGIEGGSPHHHLYEWGTTSIFLTLGALDRKREFDQDGKVKSAKETIELGITLDERITSGFYFVKSIQVLQNYLKNPSLLETV